MSGTNGISSLQKALGSLGLGDTKPVKPASTAGSVSAGQAAKAGASSLSAQTYDQASVSVAGGLAAQGTNDGDVRMDKVTALQQQIAAGTYHVAASDVADKLITSLLSGS